MRRHAARRVVATAVGRAVTAATLLGGHGGQALPGLVVGRLWPSYVSDLLGQLPEGVVVVTGTNGKTTTTKMVVEVLQACGKRVLTNPTGSNLTRGLASSVVRSADRRGRLQHDLAVFEVDEAHAPLLVAEVAPRWVLAVNISRDQLDRFGEVAAVARMVGAALRGATAGVVTNADDPQLVPVGLELAARGSAAVRWFGVAPDLRRRFPNDDELVATDGRAPAPPRPPARPRPDVELVATEGREAAYDVAGVRHLARLRMDGQHDHLNAAAALALLRELVTVDDDRLLALLGEVDAAPGRGEAFALPDGSRLVLVLVKNPAGLHQALSSHLLADPTVLLVVNDAWADGRDVSWLWDVDLAVLRGRRVAATSGTRAAEAALRLQHAGVPVGAVVPDLERGVEHLLRHAGPKLVLATYTAMVQVRAQLQGRARGAA